MAKSRLQFKLIAWDNLASKASPIETTKEWKL
jgi:hypothetical protein